MAVLRVCARERAEVIVSIWIEFIYLKLKDIKLPSTEANSWDLVDINCEA